MGGDRCLAYLHALGKLSCNVCMRHGSGTRASKWCTPAFPSQQSATWDVGEFFVPLVLRCSELPRHGRTARAKLSAECCCQMSGRSRQVQLAPHCHCLVGLRLSWCQCHCLSSSAVLATMKKPCLVSQWQVCLCVIDGQASCLAVINIDQWSMPSWQ